MPGLARRPFATVVLMRHQDLSLCPDARRAIADIADRLRRLPCDNSVVAMDLHRIARELEALALWTTATARPLPQPSAQKGCEELALTDDA